MTLKALSCRLAVMALLMPVAASAHRIATPTSGASCTEAQAGAQFSTSAGILVCSVVPPDWHLAWQLGVSYAPTGKKAKPKNGDQIITASLVDPSQIQWVSKFRSCEGHVYYGPDFGGAPEGASSMKHYFGIADSLLTTINGQQQVQPHTVKLYAPFNGVVRFFEIGGTGQGIELERQPFDGWYMSIYHTAPVVASGARVRAGQLIAYAAALPTFDVAMQRFTREVRPQSFGGAGYSLNLESLFAHMAPQAAARWSAHGVTPASIAVSRADRLSQPCMCVQNGPSGPGGAPAPEHPIAGSTGCYFESSDADFVRLS